WWGGRWAGRGLEDAPPGPGAPEDARPPLLQLRKRKEERQRIEVPLQRDVRAGQGPRLVDLDPPVTAENVGAGATEQRQVRGHRGPEDDDRHALRLERGHHLREVGEAEALEVARAQLAAPAVEDLDDA